MGGKSNDANQSRHANGRERLAHHLNLVGAFVSAGCGVRLTAIAKPERDTEADQKDSRQQKEENRLLQPGYQWNRGAHRKTEESGLQRQKAYAREECPQRKQRKENKTDRWRRQKLTNAR